MSISFFTTALVDGKLELRGGLSIKNLHSLLLEFSLSASMVWGVFCIPKALPHVSMHLHCLRGSYPSALLKL